MVTRASKTVKCENAFNMLWALTKTVSRVDDLNDYREAPLRILAHIDVLLLIRKCVPISRQRLTFVVRFHREQRNGGESCGWVGLMSDVVGGGGLLVVSEICVVWQQTDEVCCVMHTPTVL